MPKPRPHQSDNRRSGAPPSKERRSSRPSSPPVVEPVISPRLYVGNLSYEATESDLFELFNGVGKVQNAEVVSFRDTHRSKGFAFVQMDNIDEAQRAVEELHDKEFLGRKLVVSGAREDNRSDRDDNRPSRGGGGGHRSDREERD